MALIDINHYPCYKHLVDIGNNVMNQPRTLTIFDLNHRNIIFTDNMITHLVLDSNMIRLSTSEHSCIRLFVYHINSELVTLDTYIENGYLPTASCHVAEQTYQSIHSWIHNALNIAHLGVSYIESVPKIC